MIVTVNLMMKSGAALTVYWETQKELFDQMRREMLGYAEDNNSVCEFRRGANVGGKVFVNMNEVAVIEIFAEGQQ